MKVPAWRKGPIPLVFMFALIVTLMRSVLTTAQAYADAYDSLTGDFGDSAFGIFFLDLNFIVPLGSSETLLFRAWAHGGGANTAGDGNDVQLFTIPEPASLALLALGGVFTLPRHPQRGSVC